MILNSGGYVFIGSLLATTQIANERHVLLPLKDSKMITLIAIVMFHAKLSQ